MFEQRLPAHLGFGEKEKNVRNTNREQQSKNKGCLRSQKDGCSLEHQGQRADRQWPDADGGQVIVRAQQGDELAFARLFTAHRARVYRLCLRMTNDPSLAEDLTQEAFIQAFRKLPTFRQQARFSTWLHRVAVNQALMHLRRKPQDASLDDIQMTPDQEAIPREFPSEDRALTGCLDRITLGRAIASLPAGYRAVFVLHDVEGYKHSEIAGIVHCSVGNCKSQLHKARRQLRDKLRGTRLTR